MDPNKEADVIVQFKHVPAERDHAKVQGLGGRLKQHLDIVNAAVYSIPPGQLRKLAEDPDVVYLSPDREVRGALDYAAAAVNASAAGSKYKGTGIGIAVIDSGIAPHADFTDSKGKSRVVFRQDFVCSGCTGDPYGHGTHVAGIIAGSGAYSGDSTFSRHFQGIAAGANLIDLRVLDANGVGTDSRVIAAIQRAIQLKSTYNIRVINLSLGRPVFGSYLNDPLCQAVEQAWNAGIVVVVAAGNHGRIDNGGINGYGTITAPGNDPYAITVGAMKSMATPDRADDRIASYSSKGPTLYDNVVKPDLLAPGNQLVSTNYSWGFPSLYQNYEVTKIPMSYYAISGGSNAAIWYFKLNGTSMATPVVSGAVAVLLNKTPSLTPDQVKARLMKTAYKTFPAVSVASDPQTGEVFASYYDVFTVGAGYLDMKTALASKDLAGGSAASPRVVRDPVTGEVRMVFDSGVVWGTGLVWGTGVVWGTTNLTDAGVCWGTGVVWGTGSTGGTGVVWGTGADGSVDPAGVVWGTSVNNIVQPLNVLTHGEN